MREVFRLCPAEFGRQIFDGVFESGVGLAAFQEVEEMLAKGLVRVFNP
ncbi:MAG: hypothetical protein WAM79_02190 [Candidatus Sulfotelmatobacter sp.]